jgi:hypothetical protein
MPNMSSSDSRTPAAPLGEIAERLRRRLDVVAVALDRRDGASRPKAGRRKRAAAPAGRSEASLAREYASLRVVFRELGDAHRSYRSRTGHSGTPALRDAAHAFKEKPAFLSLVPVAAMIDELGILAW